MGVLDKFLDIMRLSDDDDEYYDGDDFYDEEFEDEYEEKPKKKKSKSYDDDYEEEKPSKSSRSNKVTPMRQPSKRSGGGMEVCVIKPSSVDDSREITETLLGNSTVILNLEGLDVEIAQRIIDFTSGATFAINGNLQKISNYIFLVTPTSVDISGDLQDLLSTSFDVPSVRTRF